MVENETNKCDDEQNALFHFVYTIYPVHGMSIVINVWVEFVVFLFRFLYMYSTVLKIDQRNERRHQQAKNKNMNNICIYYGEEKEK